MSMLRVLILAAAMAVTLMTPSVAHQIWIQPDTNGALQLYFGEFHENLKETSPGLLDRIDAKARLVKSNGETPMEARKGSDGFALSGQAAPGESVVVENASTPILESKAGDRVTRTIYHASARFVSDLGERGPVLTLDIVPAADHGRFKLMFRGSPLGKAKVNVVSESGWAQETRTSEAGIFEAKFPWKGPYVIEVMHTDRAAGTHQDKPYDAATFVTTLSFVQLAGLEPLPPPPAAKLSR
jgi:hypothetical protein